MKHVKTFESYNGEEDIPDSARDMFGLWTDIVFDSYKIIHDPKDLDWEKTDIVETHDHVVTWAVEAYSDDELVWYSSVDVIDGHFEEFNSDDIELESDSVNKLKKQVFDKVKEIDPSAFDRKIETIGKTGWQTQMKITKDSIRSKISWEEFVDLFKKVPHGGKQFDYQLGFTFKDLKGEKAKMLYYSKPKGEEGYWSI
jgi:hypothetical protein